MQKYRILETLGGFLAQVEAAKKKETKTGWWIFSRTKYYYDENDREWLTLNIIGTPYDYYVWPHSFLSMPHYFETFEEANLFIKRLKQGPVITEV